MPRHPADVSVTWADINKAKSLLHWSPKINVELGIKKTVDWFKENWDWVSEIKT